MWNRLRAYVKARRLFKLLLLLAVAAGVAAYALASLYAIPKHFQYLWPAPAQDQSSETGIITNSGLRAARGGMQTLNAALEGACEHTTLYAVGSGVSVSVGPEENVQGSAAVTARLEALEDGAFALKPLNLYVGRLIYPEEFERGHQVCIIDEQLAVALYKYAEPIGRTVLLGSQVYRIVGVTTDHKQVGDLREYTLYVPYRAVEKGDAALDALCVETRPIEGAGGWSAFESAAPQMGAGGTLWSMSKERMNAALPLRMLVCAVGLLIVLAAVRRMNGFSRAFYQRWKVRLVDHYAARLLPWAAGRGLLLAMGYIACAAALAEVFVLLVDPVYTFPEWVPAVLVEPSDISATFWNVWQGMAALAEYHSPEVVRIRFFRELMGWSCGAAALLGGLILGRMAKKGQGQDQGQAAPLPAAAEDGVKGS